MKVKDIMDTNVVTVTTETPYEEIVKVMFAHDLSAVPVMDDKGQVVGLVAEKDIIKVMFPRYQSYYEHPEAYTKPEDRETKAAEIKDQKAKVFMRTNLVEVSPDDQIMRVGALMLARHMSRLPVVKDGRVVGIISRRMIYRAIVKENFKLV